MCGGTTYDVLNTGVSASNQNNHADDEDECVGDGEGQVLLGVPAALLDELEPHPRGEVKCKTADEQARRDGQQVAEEGDGLGDDPRDQGDDGDEDGPRDPAHLGVDEADDRVLVHARVDVPPHRRAVDGARDEDDGERDAEGDLGEHVAGGEQRGGLDGLAHEDVDQGARDGVDDDLDYAEPPDGLDEVLGRVHLVHEGELADGERVGKDDVAEGDEGLDKCQTLLGPCRPVGRRNQALALLDPGSDDRDSDGENDRHKVNVSQDSDLGKRGREGQEEQDDSRHDAEHEGASAVVRDVSKGNGSRQTVRTDQEDELEREHDTDEFVAELAHEQLPGVGVVCDMRERELDLTDDVRGVDGDETETDAEDDTGDHAKTRKGRGDRQGTKGDGLDDEHDRQALPAQPVEFCVTLRGLALLQVVDVRYLADLCLAEHARALLALTGADGLLGLLVGGARFLGGGDVVVGHFGMWGGVVGNVVDYLWGGAGYGW